MKRIPRFLLSEVDFRGNTLLTLAGKLCSVNEKYLKIVAIFLDRGMKVKQRDSDGWNIIDEAVS